MIINKSFTLIWFGKIISQLGDKFYAIALAWWILQNTDSGAVMGLFLLACTIPAIAFGLFTGALADRWSLKRMLVITDIIRGLLVLAISVLSLADILEVWMVFVIGIGLSIATAFFDPPIQAIIPDLVSQEELPRANGLSQLVSGVCQIAGPLFGALAVSMFGMTAVFFANSISYFAAALLSALLVWKRTGQPAADGHNTLWREVLEGIRFVSGQKKIVVVLVIIGTAHFFVGSLSVTLPFLADRLQGIGVNNLGYLEMLMGSGLIAGAILGARRKSRSADERVLYKLIVGFGTGFLLISLAQGLGITQVPLYLPILLMLGMVLANASVFWQLLLQLNMSSEMKGRVFGISSLIGNLSLPVAYGITGVLLDRYTISLIMLVSGICLVSLGSVLTLISRRSRLAEA